jgi:hypothetical protein
MGMFDRVIIEDIDILPISEKEKNSFKKSYELQTKDFDCILTEIYITKEKELKIAKWKYESVPPEERPYPNATGIKSLMGCIKRVNERIVNKKYTGKFRFYGEDNNKKFYTFEVKFKKGILQDIKLIDEEREMLIEERKEKLKKINK